jgi:hypothetical protein
MLGYDVALSIPGTCNGLGTCNGPGTLGGPPRADRV